MAPGFHSARSFFGAGFRSTRDRSSGSWWRSKDGSGTVGGDGFGTEGDEDGGEDGRGRPGSRWPWKGGRRAVAAESVADFVPEEERYACVNLNARDAPPPVTPQVMRWAEDVRRERRESRVVGKLRLPPPVTTGVLKWAVEANERGEGWSSVRDYSGTYIIIGSCAVRYGTSMRGHDGRGVPMPKSGGAPVLLRPLLSVARADDCGRSRRRPTRRKGGGVGRDVGGGRVGRGGVRSAGPSSHRVSGSGSTSGTGGVSTSKTVDPVLSKRFDRTSAYGEAVDLFAAKGDGDMTEEQRFALIRAMLSSKGDGKSTGAKMELIDAVDKALANKDASNAEALKNAVEDGLKKYLDISSKRARWKVALAEAERKIREAAADKRKKLEDSRTAGGTGGGGDTPAVADAYQAAVDVFRKDGATEEEKDVAVMRAMMDETPEPKGKNALTAYNALKNALHIREAMPVPYKNMRINTRVVERNLDKELSELRQRIEKEAGLKTEDVGQWSRVRRRPVTGSGSSPRRLAPVRRRPVAAVRSTAVSKARRAPVKRKRSSVAAASSSAKSARRPGK
eukprot:jgi/Mesvir1/12055/Mv00341-RA.1